jgi:hypothetical protein
MKRPDMKQIDNRGESRFFSAMYRSIFQSVDRKVAIPTNRSRQDTSMNLHQRNELQRAQWQAYLARQNVSLTDRLMSSPVTFGVCLAVLCVLPVVAVIVCLRG